MTDEWDISWDPDINSVFSRDDAHLSTICTLIKLPSFTGTHHGDQLHLHHHGLDVMH